ncbi:MAG TPA: hypothetical protein VGU70_09180 [Methylobacterium sp.]|jgi:hypothetical protein|nr:hypothetical protein [Methylobacterium sp.]
MSELVITQGAGANRSEVLASGVVRIEGQRAFTFSYGGQTVTVNALPEKPPRKPDGNYFMPPPENTVFPNGDALHDIGGASVYVHLTPLARPPGWNGADGFLFAYEVSRPLAAPIAKAA